MGCDVMGEVGGVGGVFEVGVEVDKNTRSIRRQG